MSLTMPRPAKSDNRQAVNAFFNRLLSELGQELGGRCIRIIVEELGGLAVYVPSVRTPEEYYHSIVIRGDFNPAIFQPAWFAAEKLIGEKEAEAANVQIVHRDAAIFSADWLSLEVTQDRFSASTSHEQYVEPLQDLVIGTFILLSHTPLRMLGIHEWRLYAHHVS